MASPFVYALPIAVTGFLVAQLLMHQAIKAASSVPPPFNVAPAPAAPSGVPTLLGAGLTLRTLPMSNVLFAFVLSFIAAGRPEVDISVALLALGIVAAIASIAQGLIVRAGFATLVSHPERFGRLVTMTVIPEVATLLAFVYGFLKLTRAGA